MRSLRELKASADRSHAQTCFLVLFRRLTYIRKIEASVPESLARPSAVGPNRGSVDARTSHRVSRLPEQQGPRQGMATTGDELQCILETFRQMLAVKGPPTTMTLFDRSEMHLVASIVGNPDTIGNAYFVDPLSE
jgi:hypothetical protein